MLLICLSTSLRAEEDSSENDPGKVTEVATPKIEFVKPAAAEPAAAPPVAPPVVSPVVSASGVVTPAAQTTQTKPAAPAKGTDISPAGKLTTDLKKICDRHFASALQADLRSACGAAGPDYDRLGYSLVETRCRLTYGEDPRAVMACLIGSSIARDISSSTDKFSKKLALCSETYPTHNEIDTFLHESCLTGIHIPEIVSRDRQAEPGHDRVAMCAAITPERLFVSACAVGLSLAEDTESSVSPSKQTEACAQYFNMTRYHTGYRACLSARSLWSTTNSQPQVLDAIKSCSNISSEAGSDTERAACFVGLTIFRRLEKKDEVGTRFQKCGAGKVTYQDRDFLACLAAASLLDFTNKSGAETGCREIFKEAKSHGRADCSSSLGLF